ncbi:MAG: thioredoxin [Candidatus Pacearchaeota archaeon]
MVKREIEVEVTEKNFNEKVIKQSEKIPVVADFWAEWCMPCVMLSPTLSRLAEEYKGKFILAKVNVDENKNLAEKFEVASIPSVKMFKKGKVISSFVGNRPENMIKEWLDSNL